MMNMQPVSVSDDIDDSEEPQIVVDLKQLGVDLDKDVGRSIQKDEDQSEGEVDVTKSKLNPSAASWTPCLPAKKVQKPISKPTSVNLAPNFNAAQGGGRRTPPNVQKIAAGDGIYIQTKQKQTTLRSSRDVQNFPMLQGGQNLNMPKTPVQMSPIVAQALLGKKQRSKTLHSNSLTQSSRTILNAIFSYRKILIGQFFNWKIL